MKVNEDIFLTNSEEISTSQASYRKTLSEKVSLLFITAVIKSSVISKKILGSNFSRKVLKDERGDIPGWVLVVLMTTGLVTAIWTIAAPRLTAILRNSLDSMNGIR